METSKDKVKEESNVIDADFGGIGPRQAMGVAMKDVEHFRSVLVAAIGEDGEVYLYNSEMDLKDLALIGARVQGYILGSVNGWLEEE